jgi:hypothetical protein
LDGNCSGEGGLEIHYNSVLVSMDAFGPLTEVEGDVCILQNPILPNLSFENLESVGMNMRLEGVPILSNLEVPVLDSVGGDFTLTGGGEGGSVGVDVFSLPALSELGGNLVFSGGPALQEISVPNLMDVVGIYFNFSGSDLLANVDFSALETATYIDITQYATQTGAGAPIWAFPQLISIEQQLYMNLVAGVTTVSAPLLESAGSLFINVESDVLETFDFPALQSTTGDLYVSGDSSNANVLTNVDFGSLTAVATLDQSFGSAQFEFPTAAFDISQFVTVGATGTGQLYLFVAPYDICAEVARIVAGGFLNVSENFGCGQMTQPDL